MNETATEQALRDAIRRAEHDEEGAPVGTIAAAARAIGCAPAHLSNALAQRDALSGTKVLALHSYLGGVIGLEAMLRHLTGNRRGGEAA